MYWYSRPDWPVPVGAHRAESGAASDPAGSTRSVSGSTLMPGRLSAVTLVGHGVADLVGQVHEARVLGQLGRSVAARHAEQRREQRGASAAGWWMRKGSATMVDRGTDSARAAPLRS